jgi:hypothetical protein
MPDQKFIVGYRAEDKYQSLTVQASSVTQHGEREGTCWKISGDKGTLWVSREAFLYAVPVAMITTKD